MTADGYESRGRGCKGIVKVCYIIVSCKQTREWILTQNHKSDWQMPDYKYLTKIAVQKMLCSLQQCTIVEKKNVTTRNWCWENVVENCCLWVYEVSVWCQAPMSSNVNWCFFSQKKRIFDRIEFQRRWFLAFVGVEVPRRSVTQPPATCKKITGCFWCFFFRFYLDAISSINYVLWCYTLMFHYAVCVLHFFVPVFECQISFGSHKNCWKCFFLRLKRYFVLTIICQPAENRFPQMCSLDLVWCLSKNCDLCS